MDNFEKEITSHIQNDRLSFSTDAAILDRLMYHMQLKAAKTTVRKNSILPSLGLLFTSKMVSVKVGIAAALLISIMGYKQMNQNTTQIYLNDTAQVIHNYDTLEFAIKDSSLRN